MPLQINPSPKKDLKSDESMKTEELLSQIGDINGVDKSGNTEELLDLSNSGWQDLIEFQTEKIVASIMSEMISHEVKINSLFPKRAP